MSSAFIAGLCLAAIGGLDNPARNPAARLLGALGPTQRLEAQREAIVAAINALAIETTAARDSITFALESPPERDRRLFGKTEPEERSLNWFSEADTAQLQSELDSIVMQIENLSGSLDSKETTRQYIDPDALVANPNGRPSSMPQVSLRQFENGIVRLKSRAALLRRTFPARIRDADVAFRDEIAQRLACIAALFGGLFVLLVLRESTDRTWIVYLKTDRGRQQVLERLSRLVAARGQSATFDVLDVMLTMSRKDIWETGDSPSPLRRIVHDGLFGRLAPISALADVAEGCLIKMQERNIAVEVSTAGLERRYRLIAPASAAER